MLTSEKLAEAFEVEPPIRAAPEGSVIEIEDVRWEADHPPVEPRRFKALAASAFLADLISRAKLAELIDLPLPEIDEWVAPYRAGEAWSRVKSVMGE